MTESADTRTFEQRLIAAGEEVSYLEKSGFNKHFKYSFLEEAAVKRAVGAALRKHGLTLESVMYDGDLGVVSGQAAVLRCTVRVSYEGSTAIFQGVGAGTDSSDKAPMKACAASLKYALTSGFLIATGDDPEDDGGTKADKAPKAEKKSPTADTSEKTPSDDKNVPAPTPAERADKARALIGSAKDTAALNKMRLKVAALQQEIPADIYEPVRLAFIARTAELTTKKEG